MLKYSSSCSSHCSKLTINQISQNILLFQDYFMAPSSDRGALQPLAFWLVQWRRLTFRWQHQMKTRKHGCNALMWTLVTIRSEICLSSISFLQRLTVCLNSRESSIRKCIFRKVLVGNRKCSRKKWIRSIFPTTRISYFREFPVQNLNVLPLV